MTTRPLSPNAAVFRFEPCSLGDATPPSRCPALRDEGVAAPTGHKTKDHTPNAAAQELTRQVDVLLDPSRNPGELREAAQAWYRFAIRLAGINADDSLSPDDPLACDRILPTGKAISPIGAARCVVEYQRTAVFLRAMDTALRLARERFPGETLHVLEAGCGPLAPLALPFALRYPSDEVVFTLLDIHDESLACAQRLAGELGVRDSIRAMLQTDASTVVFAEPDRPHVIACEVLLAALAKEPQVAVTRNLSPQLREGGVFLPERIEVVAALFDSHARFAPENQTADLVAGSRGVTDLATVFVLDSANVTTLRMHRPGLLPAARIAVPPHDAARTPLHLMTRIDVFGDHRLGDFDSSLNLPRPVKQARALAATGGELQFDYELSSTPGLRVRAG